MAKPTLMFQCGFPYSATSPLCYTLQRSIKYAHGGHTKSNNFLRLALNEIKPDEDQVHISKAIVTLRKMYSLSMIDKWEGYKMNDGHRLNQPVDMKPIKGFPRRYLSNIVKTPYSIDKYVEYYKALYEQVKPYGYKAVADWQVPAHILLEFVPQLQEHFDLKVVMITRDPVRRAVARSKWHNKRPSDHNTYLKPEEKIIDNDKISTGCLDALMEDYVGIYNALKKQIPDTLMLVMEELWEGDGSEKKKLENFIGQSIPELWPNLYSPDTGHHLDWNLDTTYCPAPCQIHAQTTFEITPSYYNELRETYKYYYDSWVEEFGSLPLHWGKPVDYDANLKDPNRYTEDMFPPLIYN